MNDTISKLNTLKFEETLYIIFILLILANIYADYNEEIYLKTNNNIYEDKANQIFTITLIGTLFIYLYFFNRNYKAYENASHNEKELFEIKLFGTIFLIVGVLCLIYFQTKQSNFTGAPAP